MYARQITRAIARTAPTKLFSSRIAIRGYAKIESGTISDITAQEKEITGMPNAVKGGPTSIAQKHQGQEVTEAIVQEIQAAADTLASHGGNPGNLQNQNQNQNQNSNAQNQNIGSSNQGQTSQPSNTQNVQGLGQQNNQPQTIKSSTPPSTTLDDATIQKIAEAEMTTTGQDQPVQGGPVDHALRHANQPITSEVLSDITQGEKAVTGGQRLKGGATSVAQSALGKGLNNEGRDSLSQDTGNNNNNTNTLDTTTNSNGTPNISNSATSTLLGQQPNTPNDRSSIPITSINTGQTYPINAKLIARVAASEKKISGSRELLPEGPTAIVQKYEGQRITTSIISEVTRAEKSITHHITAVKGGPTSLVQSAITKGKV